MTPQQEAPGADQTVLRRRITVGDSAWRRITDERPAPCGAYSAAYAGCGFLAEAPVCLSLYQSFHPGSPPHVWMVPPGRLVRPDNPTSNREKKDQVRICDSPALHLRKMFLRIGTTTKVPPWEGARRRQCAPALHPRHLQEQKGDSQSQWCRKAALAWP